MSHWFRFYDEVLDDPKVQCLSPESFKYWINILCIASKNDGQLPDIEGLAFCLRCQTRKMKRVLGDLVDAGLIDEYKHGLSPHNWGDRQFKSDASRDRQRRYRERMRNVTSDVTPNVTVTVQDTDTDKDKERKERELRSPKKRAVPFPDNFIPDDASVKATVDVGMSAADVEREILNIRDWAKSKDERKIDWQSAFRLWIRRSAGRKVVPVDFKKKREQEYDDAVARMMRGAL